ncbi:MAG: acetyl-CoA carboxylase biotin carboxyl carrier protein [Sulfurospirillum sp.]|nr:acetyl-CoA carboxylase biotin carboxyl carrier protein [Sulfurospirillum sp.]
MTNKEIKDLISFFDNSDISKVKIKNDGFSIKLQKGFNGGTIVATKAPKSLPLETLVEKKESISDSIKSPMVGTFYTAPAPNADTFVKVGTIVKKGQIVGIIEAMKIMNEIEAEFDCKILEILLEDGQPVEFDMPLFAIEKV